MDRSDLERVAAELAATELYIKSLTELEKRGGSSEIREMLKQAVLQAEALTAKANSLRAALPALAGKRCWWDVPLAEPDRRDAFSLDAYIEGDGIEYMLKGIRRHIRPREERVGYGELSSRLTGDAIIFFLSKRRLLEGINASFKRRYIYNASSVSRSYEQISYLNPCVSPVSAALSRYRQLEEQLSLERESRLAEAQREHDKRWDAYEMISHQSLMTNKERWLAGLMSNEQYFKEQTMRDYYGYDKADKIKKQYDAKLSQARERALSKDPRGYVKSTAKVVGESNIIRIMTVGEVISLDDEVVAIFGYKTPQEVVELDCGNEVSLARLEGGYNTKRVLFKKTPDSIPLARHVARIYSATLPKYDPLVPCPKGASDELWRAWTEIRLLTAEGKP